VNKPLLFVISLTILLDGCGTGQVGQLPAQSTTDPSSFQLGFAMGTARIANPSGGSVVGLNAVATFRQPGGQNATLANTPSLTGPATFGKNVDGTPNHTLAGPRPSDIVAAAASGGQEPEGVLGSLIGVYGYGFAPLNLVAVQPNETVYGKQPCDGFESPSLISTSIRYDALQLPLDLVASCLQTQNSFEPIQWYGGPPAWPSAQGYGIPTGDPTSGEYFHGYPLGFMDFDDVAPASGQYTLNVAFAVGASGTQYDNVQAVATLNGSLVLPPIATPTLTINTDGSANVLLNVPVGIKEAIVEIATDYCQEQTIANAVSHYYSILTTQTGTQSLTLTNNLGPPDADGRPTDTFCTAADDAKSGVGNHRYSIAVVGFDYPAYEASYPQSTATLPTIANSAGQADITTSAPVFASYTLSGSAAARRHAGFKRP
jgi:hypothetical protein